jgi:6-phosphogluconolactonase
MSEPRLHVSDDPAAAVAEVLATQARAGGAIVLTGGSSPGKAYEQAAALEPDWSRTELWWGDERCVPPDDERSNYGGARQTLLENLERAPAAVHRIRGELEPAAAADEYADAIDGADLDLLLLGLGPDAHVASLFPDSPQLLERELAVTSGPAGLAPFVERVTLTVPTLLRATRVVFLVSGAEKADAVARAFAGDIDEAAPGSLLRLGTAPIDVYLDIAAGGRLDSGPRSGL